MTEQTYLKTRFPNRVWEQTWRGGWVSRPVTAEDRLARSEVLTQLAGTPQVYQQYVPLEG